MSDAAPLPGPAPRARRAAASLSLLAGLAALSLGACVGSARPAGSAAPTVLLFAGRGTSPNDVAAFEDLLRENHLSYATADAPSLDRMGEAELAAYRALIVPGGNFEEMGNGLTPTATTRVRNAVRSGLSYLGVCAGAFLAGDSPYNGLNLTSGVRFTFYSIENRGIRKAAVAITVPGMATLEHYWQDGPQLTGWGAVVAKYPDGTPAVVQGTFGAGSVILSGIHPEAPDNWRHGITFATPARVDNAYAATLIDAAVNRKRLAHY